MFLKHEIATKSVIITMADGFMQLRVIWREVKSGGNNYIYVYKYVVYIEKKYINIYKKYLCP